MEVLVEPLGELNAARATQLLNKTNQFNLATRRLSEAEFLDWAQAPGHAIFTFSVNDRFGRYGLTGLGGLEIDGDQALVSDYLLSCRVMGRGVEQAILHVLAQQAQTWSLARLVAQFQPTERNRPLSEFLEQSSGLQRLDDSSQRYAWDTRVEYPLPDHIRLTWPAQLPEARAS
jgi:FkbH-like protein